MINLGDLAVTYGEEVVRDFAIRNWSKKAEFLHGEIWGECGGYFNCPLELYSVPDEDADVLKFKYAPITSVLEARVERQNIEARLQWLEAQHMKDQKMITVQRQMLGLLVSP